MAERREEEQTSTYKSLFDRLSTSAQYYQQYNGKVEGALATFTQVLIDGKRGRYNRVEEYIFGPQLVIRGLIDWKVRTNDSSPSAIALIALAVEVQRLTYLSDFKGAYKKLSELERTIRKRKDSEVILSTVINQAEDSVTVEATAPHKSERTADRIKEEVGGKDILFIALAHGGVPAGMDVYLRYCASTKNTKSAFYPVRYSRRKSSDQMPQLSSAEIRHLKKISAGKTIIIFDEDTKTRHTLDGAVAYLQRTVFDGKRVIGMTNHDRSTTG
ncbi:MAG: hypothetical protein RLZZ283_623 [Candidatus Parcubacteria bacterium]|jgi:phage gp36-like protein